MKRAMSGISALTLRTPGAIDSRSLDDVVCAARGLLGCVLVREARGHRRAGIIVETEAYPHGDPAGHAYRGRDARNGSLFSGAGCAYVYRIHRSFCLNVVTGPEGRGEAVLVRAIEPTEGLDAMMRARARATVGQRRPEGYSLTNGPGKLCQAFGIGLEFDGSDLLDSRASKGLFLLTRATTPRIAVSARIGISKARDAVLRFFIEDNPWVSR
jgi:DNA-3-methyladenine glycosylase